MRTFELEYVSTSNGILNIDQPSKVQNGFMDAAVKIFVTGNSHYMENCTNVSLLNATSWESSEQPR